MANEKERMRSFFAYIYKLCLYENEGSIILENSW